jgi:hypothetical protein
MDVATDMLGYRCAQSPFLDAQACFFITFPTVQVFHFMVRQLSYQTVIHHSALWMK